MKWFAIVVFLLAIVSSALANPPIPDGWRIPTEADYTFDWKDSILKGSIPFHVTADFNGDNVPDDAYILLSTHSKAWAVFVILHTKDGKSAFIKLDENDGQTPPQLMGLAIVQPGDYETACGKGYYECDPNDPDSLHLDLPAIDYFEFESAELFIWWDKQTKSFHRTWISD